MSAESLSATSTTDPDVNAPLEVSMPPVSLGDQLRYCLRHERLERWVLGSVTTEVVRDGRCSVLVIPPTRAT